MILYNPTDKDISITYTGTQYSVKANSTVNLPDDAGEFWQKVHEFLIKETDEQKEEDKIVDLVEKPKSTRKVNK